MNLWLFGMLKLSLISYAMLKVIVHEVIELWIIMVDNYSTLLNLPFSAVNRSSSGLGLFVTVRIMADHCHVDNGGIKTPVYPTASRLQVDEDIASAIRVTKHALCCFVLHCFFSA